MFKTSKSKPGSKRGERKTSVRVVMPLEIARSLEAEANTEDRPESVQAARIIRQHFEARR